MITEPIYNQPSYSCHQDWINLYINFKKISELEAFIKKFKDKFPPPIPKTYRVSERTVWLNSVTDTGGRYFSLTISFPVGILHHIIKFNE